MLPKDFEAQFAELNDLVDFFERQICKSLKENNRQLAWSWYDSLSGAYMLAWRLGLAGPERFDRERAWSERIRTAQFGPRREE